MSTIVLANMTTMPIGIRRSTTTDVLAINVSTKVTGFGCLTLSCNPESLLNCIVPGKVRFIVTKIDGTSHDIVPYSSPDRPAKRVHFNRLKLCNSSLPPPAMRADDDDHVDLPLPEPPDAASQENFHWPDIDDPIPLQPAPPLVYHGPINRAHLRRNAGRPLRYRN